MAVLINCELCNRHISSEAIACPGCGHPLKAEPRQGSVEIEEKECDVCGKYGRIVLQYWDDTDAMMKYMEPRQIDKGEIECPACSGMGSTDEYGSFDCRRCDGKGYLRCPKCHGTGDV